MTPLFSRTDNSVLSRWWWTVDRGLLAAVGALIVAGIFLVATASPPVAERVGLSPYHFIIRHLMFLGPALMILLGVSLLPPRWVWRLASLGLVASIFAMVLVLFVGTEIKGAQRWLPMPGFSLQPSEFMKPAFAVTAAWFLAFQKESPRFPGNKIAVGLFALVLGLLVLQPDFGMSVVTSAIFGVQLFWPACRGLPWGGLFSWPRSAGLARILALPTYAAAWTGF